MKLPSFEALPLLLSFLAPGLLGSCDAHGSDIGNSVPTDATPIPRLGNAHQLTFARPVRSGLPHLPLMGVGGQDSLIYSGDDTLDKARVVLQTDDFDFLSDVEATSTEFLFKKNPFIATPFASFLENERRNFQDLIDTRPQDDRNYEDNLEDEKAWFPMELSTLFAGGNDNETGNSLLPFHGALMITILLGFLFALPVWKHLKGTVERFYSHSTASNASSPNASPKRIRSCQSHILVLFGLSLVLVHGLDHAGSIGNASLAAEMPETKSFLRASASTLSKRSEEEDLSIDELEPVETVSRELAKFGKTLPLFILGKGGSKYTRTWDHTDLFVSFKQNIQPGESPWCVAQIFEEPEVLMQSSNFVSDKRTMSNHFKDVKDVMGIDASLEISYGPIGDGKGSGSYYRDTSSTTNHVKYVVQIVQQAFALKAANRHDMKPNPELAKMAETGNFNKIVEKYGTYFVDQIIYGAGLNIIYEFTSEKEIDMEEIKAELTANINKGPLSVKFTGKFEMENGSESSKSNMQMTMSSTGIANWFFSGTTSDFQEVNNAIKEWKELYQIQKANWARNFTAMKASDTDQSVSIKQSFETYGFDAIALTMLPIHPHLPGEMDKSAVEIAQSRLMDCVDTLREVQFMMARLEQQDEDFRRLTSYEENYMDKPFYYKWLEQKASVDIHFENKMKQILDFRKLTIYQIVNYNTTLLTTMIKGLSPAERKLCDALTGSLAYRDEREYGVPIGTKVYKSAFWIGFAMDKKCVENVQYCRMKDITRIEYVPAYRGHLKCDYTDLHDRKSDSNYTVPEEIALHVPEDLCTAVPTSSAFPSLNPSKEPSAYPSTEPSGSPSAVPSFEPSLSVMPSVFPSSIPSSEPSLFPTSEPSASPTRAPSVSPTTSMEPTFACVGQLSCDGILACDQTKHQVGCSSCNGSGSCRAAQATIGQESCTGIYACQLLNAPSVIQKSCNGDLSCVHLEATIGNDSCNCDRCCACKRPGDVIPDNSCNKAGECCDALGGPLDAGVESCTGNNACAIAKSLIGANSCNGADACGGVEFATIGSNACNGENSCLASGIGHPRGSIGDGSCIGINACARTLNGEERQDDTVIIGANSCKGDHACSNLKDVNIGNGSCNCEECCKCLLTGSVVPPNSCNSFDTAGCCSSVDPNQMYTPPPTPSPTPAPTSAPTSEPIPLMAASAWATTVQSSSYPGYPASYAIDGKFDLFSHTDRGVNGLGTANPWWKLEFGVIAHVTSVTVWNRHNCCQHRLAGAILELLGRGGSVKASRTITLSGSNPISQTFYFDGGISDVQAIRVRLEGSPKILQLGEVKVSGVVDRELTKREFLESLLLDLGPFTMGNSKAAMDWLVSDTWDPAGASNAGTLWRDRYVMILLYLQGGGANWAKNTNWATSAHHCLWEQEVFGGGGANCNTKNEIEKLMCKVEGAALVGSIPSEIGSLTHLSYLLMSSPTLTGTLPTELGYLYKLTSLAIDLNPKLTGTIPTQIGNLYGLGWLGLAGNDLSGNIPTEIAHLTSLTKLFMWGNKLGGTVPPLPSSIRDCYLTDLDGGSKGYVYCEESCFTNSEAVPSCFTKANNGNCLPQPACFGMVDHVDGYIHHPEECVSGNNLEFHYGQTLQSCATLCTNYGPECVGFEFYRDLGGSEGFSEGSCILASSTDTAGCPATYWNMELYEKSRANCADYNNWSDSGGDGCWWYEDRDTEGCPSDGHNYANLDGVTANSACCWCGGGLLY